LELAIGKKKHIFFFCCFFLTSVAKPHFTKGSHFFFKLYTVCDRQHMVVL
jgi:hypothetical protein